MASHARDDLWIRDLLDGVHAGVLGGRVWASLEDLVHGLDERRFELPHDEWTAFVRSTCLEHPLRHLLHQDPLTWRAFAKPRGYAGDAVTLDYIFAADEPAWRPGWMSTVGDRIFRFTSNRPACRAVRWRRRSIADTVDRMAARKPGLRVLSISSGHLREVELSRAAREGRLGAYVALDQDAASLEVVSRDYARFGVTTAHGSVRSIVTDKVELDRFDLVYAAGLFDYLSRPVAQSLLSAMFRMLAPQGRLLVPNFLSGIRDVGYMESYMAWRLIHRSAREMLELASVLPAALVRGTVLFNDPDDNLVFLELTRT